MSTLKNGYKVRVSIIIPVYNASKTLSRCLDSIRNQEMADFEVIAVDDGSTDDSLQICSAYSDNDSRFKVFHKCNDGVSSARNKGLLEASGEWVTFIDADDYIQENYFPEYFDDGFDWLIQNRIVFGGAENRIPNEHIDKQSANKDELGDFCARYMHYDVFRSPWGKFYKTDILKNNNIRFDESFILGEDTLFCMKYMSCIKSLSVIDSAYYMYYQVSSTADWDRKYRMSTSAALRYIKEFYKNYNRLPQTDIKLLDIVYNCFYRVRFIPSSHIHRNFERAVWNMNPTIIRIKKKLGHKILR